MSGHQQQENQRFVRELARSQQLRDGRLDHGDIEAFTQCRPLHCPNVRSTENMYALEVKTELAARGVLRNGDRVSARDLAAYAIADATEHGYSQLLHRYAEQAHLAAPRNLAEAQRQASLLLGEVRRLGITVDGGADALVAALRPSAAQGLRGAIVP